MAISAAITGASAAGRTILFSTVLKLIASAPPATQVAPIRPPKSACDELEGSPRNQVSRFHRMAPTRPAKITTGLMSVSSTSPPEIVFATWTERKAPVRFRQAAIATAVLGRNAPVAIDVAMALAVSWKPFVKSKANAVSTTTMVSDRSMDLALLSCARNWVDRRRRGGARGEDRAHRPRTAAPGTPLERVLAHRGGRAGVPVLASADAGDSRAGVDPRRGRLVRAWLPPGRRPQAPGPRPVPAGATRTTRLPACGGPLPPRRSRAAEPRVPSRAPLPDGAGGPL